jgi:hypothetical protein
MNDHRMMSAAGALFFIFAGCTQSPLENKVDDPQTAQIRGKVQLSDRVSPEGVYLWLEGTAIATRTGADGQFELTLPPSSQGRLTAANGVYNLYFYLANYKLGTASVVVQNGGFLFSRGDLNAKGELADAKTLHKILNIQTIVEPATVSPHFDGPIHVQVTLRAVLDSVTVVFPKMVGGLLGAVLLKDLESGKVFADVPDVGADTKAVVKVGPEPHSWRLVILLTRTPLPVGQYEVIPYFFIEQENMPAGLLASLGPNVQEIGPDFLKIPAKREGGRLVIAE